MPKATAPGAEVFAEFGDEEAAVDPVAPEPAGEEASARPAVSRAIFDAVLFYVDLASDGVVLNEIYHSDLRAELFYPTLGALLLVPVTLSVYDLIDRKKHGGWRGALLMVLLNLTCTRVLYSTILSVRPGSSSGDAAAAARSTSALKLYETVFESVPQFYIQMIILLHYGGLGGGGAGADAALYVSLVLSVLSITYSTATKLYELLARDSEQAGTASARCLGRPVAALYFASDAVVRGVAVALLFTAHGPLLAVWAAGWVVADVAVQEVANGWLDKQEEDETKRMGCCPDCRDVTDGELCYNCFDFDDFTYLANCGRTVAMAIFGLFSPMPLSSRKRDLLRLFLLSTVVTAAALATAAADGAAEEAPFSVAVCAAVIKVLCYVAVVHRLEKGRGAVKTVGLTVLAVVATQEGQMGTWSGAQWASYFEQGAWQSETIESLRGYTSIFTEATWKAFFNTGLAQNSTLARLDLKECDISNANWAAVAEWLAQNPTLEELNADYCEMPDAGAVAIARALKTNTGLKTLK